MLELFWEEVLFAVKSLPGAEKCYEHFLRG